MTDRQGRSEPALTIDQQLNRWGDAVIECRDMAHAWRRVSTTLEEGDRVVHRKLACLRCPMQVSERFVRRTGERVHSRRYIAPPGYKSAAGRISKSDVRRESLARAVGRPVRRRRRAAA